ncbi:MAG: NAD(P)H-dependent oxidoreductase [Gemmobacter sp.]|uniref:NAD(P)H-dependent oxidoreductase n=1 Tax=Gemmobacter sp. TaxID=1898957 RepID=UPI001A3E9C12|nr:NAD(P)H-dependent oxidoreductase [Gemmobacter sp.]MBL8562927.1 NAD(P)H-dependent oxidoreductase [Gemmobacter sp.]
MKVLVLYCHPEPHSFCAAIRDRVLDVLAAQGAEIRLTDLYAEGFDPVLRSPDLARYAEVPGNAAGVAEHAANLLWCDRLVLIHPTWWGGLPAMLKGWMDRVLLPGIAFHLPDGPGVRLRPGLRQIGGLLVLTTCGAGPLAYWLAGATGRRQVLRSLGVLCKPLGRRRFLALYRMDLTTADSRARHLDRVARAVARL